MGSSGGAASAAGPASPGASTEAPSSISSWVLSSSLMSVSGSAPGLARFGNPPVSIEIDMQLNLAARASWRDQPARAVIRRRLPRVG